MAWQRRPAHQQQQRMAPLRVAGPELSDAISAMTAALNDMAAASPSSDPILVANAAAATTGLATTAADGTLSSGAVGAAVAAAIASTPGPLQPLLATLVGDVQSILALTPSPAGIARLSVSSVCAA